MIGKWRSAVIFGSGRAQGARLSEGGGVDADLAA